MKCHGQPVSRDNPGFAEPVARDIKWYFGCLLLLAMLYLSACGGSSSTGTTPSEETLFQSGQSGPGDSDNFFPFSVGDLWIYQGTDSTDSGVLTYHNVVYVDRIEQQQGLNVFVVTHTNALADGPTDEFLLVDAHGLATLGSSDTDSPDAQLSPYWNVLFPPLAGDRFIQLDRSNIDFGEDLDGDATNERAELRSEVLVQGLTPVSTHVTDYKETLQLDLNSTVALRLSANGSRIDLNSTESLFFVRDIGLVDRQLQLTLMNQTTTTWETLAAYKVGTIQRAGFMPINGAVSEQQGNGISYYAFDVVKGETYLVAMTGVTGQADLQALLPGSCLSANTGLAGAQAEDCVMTAAANHLLLAVAAPASASFVLSVAATTNQISPADEINLGIVVDQPTPSQVGPRGTSRYAVPNLINGRHTVSIVGLSGDADLQVFSDDTYSVELDCTLRAPTDVTAAPEECSVDNASSLYFMVSSGELNPSGATFFILVH